LKKSPNNEISISKVGRRQFVQGLAFATTAFGAFSSSHAATKSKKTSLKAAGYRFPRLEALFDGGVAIEGHTVSFEETGIGDANSNIFSGPQTWDITEIGLHPFMLAYANDSFRDYTLLPIFPLRLFRHKSIFIRADSGIKTPADLRGRSIGTPGYSSTSLTWIRGMLRDEYGIKPEDINWVFSRKDSSSDVAGKISKQENVIPEGLRSRFGPSGVDESELLLTGEVDALFHAATPKAFLQRNPNVIRLFKDSRDVELSYFKKTGIFPIMHAVAIRRELVDRHPEIVKAIFEAYSMAKSLAYSRMVKMGWAEDMLPWYGQELEYTTAAMGSNFYSYGIESNRKTLETLFRYSHEQGLCDKRLAIGDLFHADSLALTES